MVTITYLQTSKGCSIKTGLGLNSIFSNAYFYVKSPPHEFGPQNINEKILSNDSKNVIRFEIRHLGPELWLTKNKFVFSKTGFLWNTPYLMVFS